MYMVYLPYLIIISLSYIVSYYLTSNEIWILIIRSLGINSLFPFHLKKKRKENLKKKEKKRQQMQK